MRKQWLLLITAGSFLIFTFCALKAQAEDPVNAAAVTAAPEPNSIVSDENKNGDEETDNKEAPFVPHWTGLLGLNYSSQPSQLGQGQITRDLTFTGTYNITESGHFVSLGLAGGQQKVEGADTNYGSLALDGGLGLGFFLPSLSVSMQRGSAVLNSADATLTLNFQIFEPLTVGLTLSGGTESHQGPNPITQAPNTFFEIDSANWTGGIVAGFVPWNFLSLSLTVQQEYSLTYQWQNITNTTKTNLDQSERIPSINLGADVTFLKDFVLELSGQVGQEYYPAGTVYSAVLRKTVTFVKPTTQNFSGYSMGLMYNFQ